MYNSRHSGFSRGIALLNLGAIVVLGLSIAELGLKFWDRDSETKPGSVEQTGIGQQPAPSTSYRIEQIVSAHLFGHEVEAQAIAVEAPETQLRLRLLGVVASDDATLSRALVARDSAPTRSYAVGELVDKTDAKIHAIESTRVLLERNGRLESLPIVRPDMSSKVSSLTIAPQEQDSTVSGAGEEQSAKSD